MSRHLLRLIRAGICVHLLLVSVMTAAPSATAAGTHVHTKIAVSMSPRRCSTRVKPRGTITFSDWQFPDTLNPYQSTRLVTRDISTALFENLFQYDNHARIVTQMAAVVPTPGNGGVKDGGRTIVIRLKSGLHWSNGAEVTSRDIWFGWKVGMDPITGPACLGSCDAIARIDTPSRYTAVIRLKRTYASAVPSAMPDLWPAVWPHAWNGNPHAAATRLGTDPSFTFERPGFPTDGPYQVVKFVPGSRIELRPMKWYSDASCGAYIQNLTFVGYGSKLDLIDAAATRKTDVTFGYTLADVPQLAKHPKAYSVRMRTTFTLEHLEFNLDRTYRHRTNPLADQRVRMALALALDKVGLIRSALQATSKQASNLAAWTPFAHASDLQQPMVASTASGQWDPIAHRFVIPGTNAALNHARQLLARTPFKNGFSLDFYTTTGNYERQAQEAAIASSWAKLKVKVRPNYVSDSRLLGTWEQGGVATHGNFQVAMFAYVGSPDPDEYKYNIQSRFCNRASASHSTINGNNSCIHDPAIDRAFTQAARTLSPGVRSTLYATIGKEMNQHAYWIPLYFEPAIVTDDGSVAHLSINPTQSGPTWNIADWRASGS